MKSVIINADDFGLTEGINRGIIKAHQEGILTSTSIITNMPAYEDAVCLAKKNPRLGIGVHLNLIRGRSILPKSKITTLVDSENKFLQNGLKFLINLVSGKIQIADIKSELNAQISKVIDSGINPSHLDSEKHLHLLPGIINIVVELAKEKGIRCIRWINEALNLNKKFVIASLFNKQFYKCLFLNNLSKRCISLIKKNNLITTDNFFGIINTGYMNENVYKRLFFNLENINLEIMTHPGYIDVELEQLIKKNGGYFINKFRKDELKALLNPELKDLVKKLDIRLINFHDLRREI